MEDKIKNILSLYIKIPVNQINAATVIDRSAVAGSILLHRMYANLANEGILVKNYWDIKNYGTLLQRVDDETQTDTSIRHAASSVNNIIPLNPSSGSLANIGIDVEEISAMPQVNDFREDSFYKMNFTDPEISFCILQPRPLASFAGLFAAKEAIVKANNAYKGIPFNAIAIDHLPAGKPLHKEFELSISHTNEVVVAVAIQININAPSLTAIPHSSSSGKSNPVVYLLSLVLLFLIIIASLLIYHK